MKSFHQRSARSLTDGGASAWPAAGGRHSVLAGWVRRLATAFGRAQHTGPSSGGQTVVAFAPRWVRVFSKDFQSLLGPLVTTAVVVGVGSAAWHDLHILYLPVLLVLAVAFSAYVGGFKQGFVSAALAWAYLSLYMFATPLSAAARMENWAVWTAVLPAVVAFTGALQRRAYEQEYKLWAGRVEPFRLVSESVSDLAIMLLDRDGKITSWNSAAVGVFGWSFAEIKGQTLTACFDTEETTKGAAENLLQTAIARGRAGAERWCVRRHGERFRAKLGVTALHEETGSVTGYTVSLQDLTEREQAASALLRRAHQQVAVAALSQNRADQH